MSMHIYIERLTPIVLLRTRKKQRNEMASTAEFKQNRSLAATLMYLGNGVLPQSSFIMSMLQQMIEKVRVEHLAMANGMLAELVQLKSWITYKSPSNGKEIKHVLITTFSDASFNHSSRDRCVQTGFLTALRIAPNQGMDYYHLLDWCSNKEKRVSYSP